MDEFGVSIAKQDESILKVTWRHNGITFLPYNVDLGMVRRRSQNVRDSAAALVAQCMDSKYGGTAESGPALMKLAANGRELYSALFLDDGDSEQNVGAIKKYFERYPDARLKFTVDRRVQIPWGLIYGGEQPVLRRDGTDTAFDRYRNFWSIKHRLTTVYRKVTEDRVRRPMPAGNLILPILNREAYEQAKGKVTCPTEMQWFEGLLTVFKPAYTRTEFEERWKKDAVNIGLLNFFCHASGTELVFGSDDKIDSDQLRMRFEEAKIGKREWSCLLMLNGCSTATGDPSGAFLEAVGEDGIAGFIGTETEVPDVFALRFGMEFLKLFRAGQPLDEVMATLRARHFPLSLVYSVYTYPLLQVVPESVEGDLALCSHNFSDDVLGESRI